MSYIKKEYQQSDAVTQAQLAYEQQKNNRPGDYVSVYQPRLDGLLTQLQNRKPFRYEINDDALYRQYRDQYTRLGRQAMMDTMGRAAAMTGGYNNSYGQTASQQTYQNYLQGLNDRIPELYALALEKYTADGDGLKDQYEMLSRQEQSAYAQYRDQMDDWNTETERLYQQYLQERSFEYGVYSDEEKQAYDRYRDEVADRQWQSAFDYQQKQNLLAHEKWLQEFEYQKKQDQLAYEQWLMQFQEDQRRYDQQRASYSSGGSGRSSGGSKNTAASEDTLKAHSFVENMLKNATSSRFDPERVISITNQLTTEQKKEAQSYLQTVLAAGRMK